MGRNKLLLSLEGESLLRRAVRSGLAAGLDPMLVVLGHEADRAASELTGLSYEPVSNPDHLQGIHTSVRAGIAAVPEAVEAAVVLLADMPLVTDRMIRALVERYRESGAPLVLSDYAGVQAPPTLYGRALFGELLGGDAETCSKKVIRRHAGEAVSVPWPAETLTDLDRPEDYERVKAELSARPTPCVPIS
jgi:molybdenum cofactor cytidylyltransferase